MRSTCDSPTRTSASDPPRSADSYLNVPAIISAAEITGADALHPGYGFLSESAYLAEVCEACHIRFIGPDPERHSVDGRQGARPPRDEEGRRADSARQRQARSRAKSRRAKIAKDIGYPVIIKATAGGGGRGMRVVQSPAELQQALKTAQREAEAAFGIGDVYVEKYVGVTAPHRVPGARRSLRQRRLARRARVLDSAPSSEADRGIAVGCADRQVRRKMGGVVVDAARAVQYANAGTFEFLMDKDGRFYFMEVNTRLQVEHPVTEMVTGIDIVKEQIRIAAGERLSFKQSEITFTGHAIECRINAEDPETFTPSPGTIHAFSVPGGPGVRIDTAAHTECTISPYYDSMIAKFISYGRDRQEAIARMRRTLEMTVIEGIKTTIPLHLKILAEPDFQAGSLSTSFMDRFQPPARKGDRLREAV